MCFASLGPVLPRGSHDPVIQEVLDLTPGLQVYEFLGSQVHILGYLEPQRVMWAAFAGFATQRGCTSRHIPNGIDF